MTMHTSATTPDPEDVLGAAAAVGISGARRAHVEDRRCADHDRPTSRSPPTTPATATPCPPPRRRRARLGVPLAPRCRVRPERSDASTAPAKPQSEQPPLPPRKQPMARPGMVLSSSWSTAIANRRSNSPTNTASGANQACVMASHAARNPNERSARTRPCALIALRSSARHHTSPVTADRSTADLPARCGAESSTLVRVHPNCQMLVDVGRDLVPTFLTNPGIEAVRVHTHPCQAARAPDSLPHDDASRVRATSTRDTAGVARRCLAQTGDLVEASSWPALVRHDVWIFPKHDESNPACSMRASARYSVPSPVRRRAAS